MTFNRKFHSDNFFGHSDNKSGYSDDLVGKGVFRDVLLEYN